MPPKPPRPCIEAGNCATPQKHEHAHAPPGVNLPEPLAIPALAVCVDIAADIIAVADAWATVAIVFAIMELVGMADDAATKPAVVPVPFCAMAICLNISWVLFAVGLMEKTIPFPQ